MSEISSLRGEPQSKAVENLTDTLFWGGLITTAIGVATKNKTLTRIGGVAAGTGGIAKIAQQTIQEKKKTEREVKYYITMNVIKEEQNTEVYLNQRFF